MTMTLESVRDWHRKHAQEIAGLERIFNEPDYRVAMHNSMADAIDAHLAQSVDVAGLHSRIGKDLENPRFWLDALRISMHTTDCPAKLQALTNAHRELSKFVTAALQEKGNGAG